jgi:hypothetical protein
MNTPESWEHKTRVWMNLIFAEAFDYDQTRKELQLQVESCEVKGVATNLIINGSSPGTQMFMHDNFKTVKDIFAKVEFVDIMLQLDL